VENYDWNWLDNVVGDISEVKVQRVAIAAEDRAYITLAETKEQTPKTVTIELGGDDEDKKVGVRYTNNGDVYPQAYREEKFQCENVLKGTNSEAWLELDWSYEEVIKVFLITNA